MARVCDSATPKSTQLNLYSVSVITVKKGERFIPSEGKPELCSCVTVFEKFKLKH